MKITKEQLLKGTGLKIGDKINVENNESYNPYVLSGDLLLESQQGTPILTLRELIFNSYNFEIIEDKIWDINEIEDGHEYYFVGYNTDIKCFVFCGTLDDETAVKKSIAFKNREYAEEYRKELLKFNEEYKRKHRG